MRRHPGVGELARVAPARYEIRIRGALTADVLPAFDPLESEVQSAETVLQARVRDQAELHGLLHLVDAHGLELVRLRRVHDAA
jgi:hypothetical protein